MKEKRKKEIKINPPPELEFPRISHVFFFYIPTRIEKSMYVCHFSKICHRYSYVHNVELSTTDDFFFFAFFSSFLLFFPPGIKKIFGFPPPQPKRKRVKDLVKVPDRTHPTALSNPLGRKQVLLYIYIYIYKKKYFGTKTKHNFPS